MGLSREDYVDALEKERRKMEVFQRELPLCIDLVAKVIEKYRREMAVPAPAAEEENCRGREVQRCNGEVGTPVLEEFIPLRPLDVDDNDNDDTKHRSRCVYDVDDGSSEKKSDWLKAAQLWNQNPTSSKDDNSSIDVVERDKFGQQQQRKTRRCWSPELHRRFVHALQQLGGSNATPKQIRDLMKVDGLTNDEVKSHLQKYRLHTRKPSPVSDSNLNRKTQQPELVFGICIHPSGFTSITDPKNSTNIVTTAAAYNCRPQPMKQAQLNRSPRGPLRSDDASSSGLSATSTSS